MLIRRRERRPMSDAGKLGPFKFRAAVYALYIRIYIYTYISSVDECRLSAASRRPFGNAMSLFFFQNDLAGR